MKKSLQLKRTIMFFMSVVILAVLTGIFWITWESTYSNTILIPFYRKGNWLVVAIYAALLFIFTNIYGGYKIGYYRISDIIYSQLLSLVFINIITYFQISLINRFFVDVLPFLVMTIVEFSAIVIWAYLANRLYFNLYPPKKMIMVYGSKAATSLVYKMSLRSDKYQICSVISIEAGFEEIVKRIEEYEAVVICDVPTQLRNRILKYCFHHSIRTYITPKITDIIIGGSDQIHLFDTPLFLCKNRGLSFEQKVLKRFVDLLVSTLAILITSPIMLVVAVSIKLCDRGPVLFKQDRLTLNGRVFSVYKFRSMITDAEKDGVARLASENDDRITPVGKVLRTIRLDELPQFFNVFKGDMSLVGPRPERPEIAAQYRIDFPEFDFRLKVKAGLTGNAQILGKYNTTPYDKLKLDLMYIEHYSIFLDLKLLLMTIKILFISESTEGIPEGAVLPDHEAASKLVENQNQPKKDGE